MTILVLRVGDNGSSGGSRVRLLDWDHEYVLLYRVATSIEPVSRGYIGSGLAVGLKLKEVVEEKVYCDYCNNRLVFHRARLMLSSRLLVKTMKSSLVSINTGIVNFTSMRYLTAPFETSRALLSIQPDSIKHRSLFSSRQYETGHDRNRSHGHGSLEERFGIPSRATASYAHRKI